MSNLKFHLDKDLEQVSGGRQEELRKQVDFLKKQPQPEQRTQLWYDMRTGMVTASDWGTILGDNPYSNVKELILKKCGHEMPFPDNAAIRWGVKYEDVAIQIYEARNNTKVIEYGLIQHPEFSYLGASPDGITDEGVMVEIKCPSKRQITGIPPVYYYDQVQGQLEVCKLDRCDFLECKLAEYDNEDDYFADNFEGDYTKTDKNKEKGFTLEFLDKKTKKYKFEFGPIGVNKAEMMEWTTEILNNKYKNNTQYIYAGPSFWKLIEVSCIPIYRDKQWFEKAHIGLKAFWDKVCNYRKNGGVEELLKPKKEKPIYITTDPQHKYTATSMHDYIKMDGSIITNPLPTIPDVYMFSDEVEESTESPPKQYSTPKPDMGYMFSDETEEPTKTTKTTESTEPTKTTKLTKTTTKQYYTPKPDMGYMFSDDTEELTKPLTKPSINVKSKKEEVVYMFSE